MIFSNDKTYKILKYIAVIVIPALVTLIITLGNIWGIPYADAIAATVSAIGLFMSALLQISSNKYDEMKKNETEQLRDILVKHSSEE